jgi:predicted Fe-Mo cluster-binding NifX family protein
VEENETLRARLMKRPKKKPTSELGNATKILIPLSGDDVAPRFDLAHEAFIATIKPDGEIVEERTIILSAASAESLCHLILTEKVETVVCCGIDDEYYQYLTWKKVKVLDSVIGSYVKILNKVKDGTIRSGDILLDRVPHMTSRT